MLYCLKILENIESVKARSSIIWLLGQYFQFFPTISQDVLRNLVQGFANENEEVKLQILNFAAKVFAAKIKNENTERTNSIIQYLYQLASFDQSYTVRQKSRLLKSLLFPDSPDKDETTRSRILGLLLAQNLKINGPGMSETKKIEKREEEILSGKYHLTTISFLVFLLILIKN